MPNRRTQSRSQTRSVILGVVVVVLLMGAMGLISVLASEGVVEPQFGERVVGPYAADDLAARVADDGPILFADASGNRSLDVFVQHLGDDPDEGWSAFLARAPGVEDRSCTLEWDADGFVDPCDGATYPADGAGLEQFTIRVEDGRLYVDFGAGSAG